MQWKTICFIIMGIFLRVCLHSCSKCSFKVCPVPVAYHCLWVFSPFHHPHPTPGSFPGSAPFLTPPVSSPASCSSIHKTQMLAQKKEGKEKGHWLTLSASGVLQLKWQETPGGLCFAPTQRISLRDTLSFLQQFLSHGLHAKHLTFLRPFQTLPRFPGVQQQGYQIKSRLPVKFKFQGNSE